MQEVKRDTFWMIGTELKIALYVLAFIAIAVFLYGFYRRFRLWRKGVNEKITWNDIKQNISYLYEMAVKQSKVKKDKLVGILHQFISYGFVVLFIGTVLVVVDYDFKIPLLQGNFYLFYELILDIFGVLFIIGLCWVIYVRMAKKRERLKEGLADYLFLVLMLLISIGGYITEAIRLDTTQVDHAIWSPVGYFLAKTIGDSPMLQVEAYGFWWMSHAVLAFILIAIIPYTKLFHFFTAPLNLLFQPVKRSGKINLPYVMNGGYEEIEQEKVLGAQKVYDFTNWQLLSTDACTECGRCDSQCPAHASGKPLAPRSIVTKIRDNMDENRDIASFISKEELQACTTCGACVEACPVSINHIDLILSMRRGLIQDRVIEEEAENTLLKVEEQFNIWGEPWSDRMEWSKGRNIKDLSQQELEREEA